MRRTLGALQQPGAPGQLRRLDEAQRRLGPCLRIHLTHMGYEDRNIEHIQWLSRGGSIQDDPFETLNSVYSVHTVTYSTVRSQESLEIVQIRWSAMAGDPRAYTEGWSSQPGCLCQDAGYQRSERSAGLRKVAIWAQS